MTIHKAVIPAAGLGHQVPARHEVDSQGDAPGRRQAGHPVRRRGGRAAPGLDDVLLITGRSKRTARRPLRRRPRARGGARGEGRPRTARPRSASPPTSATCTSSARASPRASGTPCSRRKHHVGAEPFAVLLGDDLIDERDELLSTMLALQERTRRRRSSRCSRCPPAQISMYGCAAVEPFDGDGDADQVRVDRPSSRSRPPTRRRATSRSSAGTCSTPRCSRCSRARAPGRGGEIQLTDALATLAEMPADQGGGVYGVVFRGRRYDTGDRLDYLKAVVQIAVDRPDLGPDFRAWLARVRADPQLDG